MVAPLLCESLREKNKSSSIKERHTHKVITRARCALHNRCLADDPLTLPGPRRAQDRYRHRYRYRCRYRCSTGTCACPSAPGRARESRDARQLPAELHSRDSVRGGAQSPARSGLRCAEALCAARAPSRVLLTSHTQNHTHLCACCSCARAAGGRTQTSSMWQQERERELDGRDGEAGGGSALPQPHHLITTAPHAGGPAASEPGGARS